MILDVKNRSLHQDRSQKFRLKYLQHRLQAHAARKTFAPLQSRFVPLKIVILRHIAPHVVEKSLCFNIARKR